MAVVFIDRTSVVRDPSSFHRACEGLEAVRQAARPHGIRVLVCVTTQGPLPEDLPEDKAAIIRRYADIGQWGGAPPLIDPTSPQTFPWLLLQTRAR